MARAKTAHGAPRILLTGATGFVGQHIYPELLTRGFDVLCATRDPVAAAKKDPTRRYCHFDLASRASVAEALSRVDRAVYLVHSMSDGKDYEATEHESAETFREEAEKAELERIVYLGGMRPRGKVSRHLESRLRTGATLRAGRVPTVELQATMIIGGGSESFRIVRDLAARLPFMLLPAWLESESEPVAVRDVAAAIVRALEIPITGSVVLTVPGPERVSGKEIILRTARLLGNRPRALPVPVVTPKLSSYWIRLVTRAHPQVATELVEGLRSDIVSEGAHIWASMPGHARMPFDAAVRAALAEEADTLPRGSRVMEAILHRFARPEHVS